MRQETGLTIAVLTATLAALFVAFTVGASLYSKGVERESFVVCNATCGDHGVRRAGPGVCDCGPEFTLPRER